MPSAASYISVRIWGVFVLYNNSQKNECARNPDGNIADARQGKSVILDCSFRLDAN